MKKEKKMEKKIDKNSAELKRKMQQEKKRGSEKRKDFMKLIDEVRKSKGQND